MSIAKEIQKRRTFAIISHPDAGKTTLTEKLLLYGGAVQLAGSVTARKNQRATTSDWMELEKKRGISISSTVLQFDYAGYRINLRDTPGHKDFSEDTYRVLTAVAAVVTVCVFGKQTSILSHPKTPHTSWNSTSRECLRNAAQRRSVLRIQIG